MAYEMPSFTTYLFVKQVELFVTDEIAARNPMGLATELTISWLENPNTRTAAEDVLKFLNSMHATISGLMSSDRGLNASEAGTIDYSPAVTARKSLASPDVIVSMIDGKSYKTLRRHLTSHGLTPSEYRVRYGLKNDYPMVAPTYSERRRAMAKRIGLGRKPGKMSLAEVDIKPASGPRKRSVKQAAAE